MIVLDPLKPTTTTMFVCVGLIWKSCQQSKCNLYLTCIAPCYFRAEMGQGVPAQLFQGKV